MEIRPLTAEEQKYTYAQSMQLEGQTGCIGHLRGDFAHSGYGFYTTWSDTREQWKTDEFKSGLDDVINALREDKGLLHNRYDMGAFAKQSPESAFKGSYCTEYGFRVDTDKHAFLLRCNPARGDYNFYCYCYVKEWLDKHISRAGKGIRFIDPHYKELFRSLVCRLGRFTACVPLAHVHPRRRQNHYHFRLGRENGACLPLY